MTDAQIDKVLGEGRPVAAVLLTRGAWLSAAQVRLRLAFEADERGGAVWCVELHSLDDDSGKPWHQVFVEAASIVGVSLEMDRAGG